MNLLTTNDAFYTAISSPRDSAQSRQHGIERRSCVSPDVREPTHAHKPRRLRDPRRSRDPRRTRDNRRTRSKLTFKLDVQTYN